MPEQNVRGHQTGRPALRVSQRGIGRWGAVAVVSLALSPVGAQAAPITVYDPAAIYDVDARDVEYRRAGSQAWLTRVYQPRGVGPFPMLVDLHPGVWVGGDRTTHGALDRALAVSGVVVVSPDFRLGTQEPYPASVVDANYAVRWTKAHAREFNGTSTSLGVMGGSSGGHMAMLGAMRPNDPRYNALPLLEAPTTDASVARVMAWGAVLDPYARYLYAQKANRTDLISGQDTYFRTTDATREANPQLILERGEKALPPPALLIQGTADENFPYELTDKFVAAYRAAGGNVQREGFPGMKHVFLTWPAAEFDRGIRLMKGFIAQQLVGMAAASALPHTGEPNVLLPATLVVGAGLLGVSWALRKKAQP